MVDIDIVQIPWLAETYYVPSQHASVSTWYQVVHSGIVLRRVDEFTVCGAEEEATAIHLPAQASFTMATQRSRGTIYHT